jgi:two-component system alkaline phosphatase synthesis response regulator PhoP
MVTEDLCMIRNGRYAILVVDDEPDIVRLLATYLEQDGFAIRTAETGTQALASVKEDKPDLIILDLMLPDLDGFEVCRAIRTNPSTALIPILMLTARVEESDTLTGFEVGADDYVTKPFSPKPLVARVKALLRRTERAPETQSIYRYKDVVIDLERHQVTVADREILLTLKEFRLLLHLMRHVGRVLTREVLLNHIWGPEYYVTDRTVDVHIRRLKRKIPLLTDAIVSVKNLGYKLRDP